MQTEMLTSYFIYDINTKQITPRKDLKLRFQKLNPKAKIPIRAHTTDAGIDFFSTVSETIPSGSRRVISTGLRTAVPEGWALILKDKSGLAVNNGLHVLGGVVDSEYRGDIGIILVNLSKERVDIMEGQKIAQGLLVPVGIFDIQEVQNIPTDTGRGEGGFGSTGLK